MDRVPAYSSRTFSVDKEFDMSKVCEICGKGPRSGNTIVRRGLAKKKGGIGLHTTGITKRRFLPNIQKIRVRENGGVCTRRVCTSCIKAGKVTKA
jgi:large subunit ribosomal protein L28